MLRSILVIASLPLLVSCDVSAKTPSPVQERAKLDVRSLACDAESERTLFAGAHISDRCVRLTIIEAFLLQQSMQKGANHGKHLPLLMNVGTQYRFAYYGDPDTNEPTVGVWPSTSGQPLRLTLTSARDESFAWRLQFERDGVVEPPWQAACRPDEALLIWQDKAPIDGVRRGVLLIPSIVRD